MGSSAGKRAFLTNDPVLFGATGSVHYAGSDSVLRNVELLDYLVRFNEEYGPLIQIPRWSLRWSFPIGRLEPQRST